MIKRNLGYKQPTNQLLIQFNNISSLQLDSNLSEINYVFKLFSCYCHELFVILNFKLPKSKLECVHVSPENKPHYLMLIYAFLTDETRAYDFNPGFLFAAVVAFHILKKIILFFSRAKVAVSLSHLDCLSAS